MFFNKINKIVFSLSSVGVATGIGFSVTDDYKKQGSFHLNCPKWDSNWDRRSPESLLKPGKEAGDSLVSTATRHLIMVRHGHYNLGPPIDVDRKLTTIGREQAELLGERLKQLNLPYDKIIVSTLTRANETTEIVSKYLPQIPIEVCQFIHEGAPIPPDPPLRKWKPSYKQFYEDGARIEAAFRKHFYRAPPTQKKDSYELVICHANVIRYFLCRALQLPPDAWLRFSLHHCSYTWLAIRPSGRVVCLAVGDSGHLPRKYMTTNS